MRYDPTHPSYVTFLDAFLDSDLSGDPTITPFPRTPGLVIPANAFDALSRGPNLSIGMPLRDVPKAMVSSFDQPLTFGQHRFTPSFIQLVLHEERYAYAVSYHHTFTPAF